MEIEWAVLMLVANEVHLIRSFHTPDPWCSFQYQACLLAQIHINSINEFYINSLIHDWNDWMTLNSLQPQVTYLDFFFLFLNVPQKTTERKIQLNTSPNLGLARQYELELERYANNNLTVG